MSDWVNSAHAHLLRTHLQAFVPLMIHEFITGARLLVMPRPDLSQYIAENGDAIIHRIPGRTAQAIGAVVEAIATMAFCPDGVRFMDTHFEVPPEQARMVIERDMGTEIVLEDEPDTETAMSTEDVPPQQNTLPLTRSEIGQAYLARVYPSFEKLFRHEALNE